MSARRRGAALLGALIGAALVLGGARRAEAFGGTGVGELLAAWKGAPTDEGKLEDDLVALGADAAPELARLVKERAAQTDASDTADTSDAAPIAPLARALARVAGAASVASLEPLSRSVRAADRAAAVSALAAVPTKESLDLVTAALNGDSLEAAEAAVEALPKLMTADPDQVSQGRLLAVLHDARRPDLAARVLGHLHTPEAHEQLLEMLKSNDVTVQSAAFDGLWYAATADDIETVRPFLAPARDRELRKRACLLLGRLHDREVVAEMIDLLADSDEGLATNAHWALREITMMRLGAERELWSAWWGGGGSQTYAGGSGGGSSSSSAWDSGGNGSASRAAAAAPLSPRSDDDSGIPPAFELLAALLAAAVLAGVTRVIVVLRRKRAVKLAALAAAAAAQHKRLEERSITERLRAAREDRYERQHSRMHVH